MKNKAGSPELLAPAGHVESFTAALENGADAVYLGLKQFSARASATNFTPNELSFLVPYAHERNVSVYVALNSSITAREFPGILDTLQTLSDLQVDALIVQDPGIFYLVRNYFPHLKLHASTLTAVHNHAGVNELKRLGAQRIVLARELSLREIEQITSHTEAEVEIFVHGALCFSYSGLCLASSFRGGHSGLQGRCVQPCRLRFKQGRKEGFFISCNDLCALPWIPRLKKLRLAALKIEGRMKSADYIAQVVKAYRLVLDAPPDRTSEAVDQAREWLMQSPSRRLTSGFLGDRPNEEVLVPHRSGSSGLWIGTINTVQEDRITLTLRHDLRPGDRLRPESQEEREEKAFTVSKVFSEKGAPLSEAHAGDRVRLLEKGTFHPGERLFKVGTKGKPASQLWQEIRRAVPSGLSFAQSFRSKEKVRENLPTVPVNPRRPSESLAVKIGRAGDLPVAFQSPAQWVMLTATRSNLEQVAKRRVVPAHKNRFVWSLPVLLDEKEMDYYRAAIRWYRDQGFLSWEVNNWGHFDFFKDRKPLELIAGYRFNLRNQAAQAMMAEAGCRWSVLSLEITREELVALSQSPFPTTPMVSVYAWPPLFTSRLAPKLREDKHLMSPRKEAYFVNQKGGYTYIYADQPVNWFDQLPLLRSYGYRHFIIDLSEGPHNQMENFERLLNGFNRSRTDKPYSLFNFDRSPLPRRPASSS